MEELCALINRLLRKHVNETHDSNVSRASKAIGIPYKILRDIYNGDAKSISFMNAQLIFQLAAEDGDSYLARIFPIEYETQRRAFNNLMRAEMEKSAEFAYGTSDIITEIYNYCLCGAKTLEDVIRWYGESGRRCIADMIDNNVVKLEENGFIKTQLGEHIVLRAKLCKKAVSATLSAIDPEMRGTIFSNFQGGLNLKGWKIGYDATLNYIKYMSSLSEDPELQGSIPIIGGVAIGPIARAYDEGKIDE